MRFMPVCLLLAASQACVSLAQTPVDFQGKTINLIVGFPPGGGTDGAGRVIASHYGRHLPGNPGMAISNVPGAEGVTAMNYFVQQARPDGLSLTMGSGSLGDPIHYRKPQSKYDPTKLSFIAGSGRGGSALIVSAAAAPRLFDKSRPPVVMGSTTGIPRSGMLMTAWGIEFLDWNARWVVGYAGTSTLMLALERGEIEMTSTSNLPLIQKLVASGRFRVLAQSGALEGGRMVARGEMPDTPVFENMMEGRIADPVARAGFVYWRTLNAIDKWLALPAQTPEPILAAYRRGFSAMLKDAAFLDQAKKISEDFEPRSGSEVETLIATLGATPVEATAYIDAMLRRQGLTVE